MENYDYAFFNKIVHQVVTSPNYQKMKQYIHHGNVTCYTHCYNVALYSYLFALKYRLKVDYVSLIRGALLHDYYLYDWHSTKGRKRWHGFRHPRIAYINAKRDFEINRKEKDIILKHMWPLTIFFIPRYKESFIVMHADNMVTIRERYALFIKKNA